MTHTIDLPELSEETVDRIEQELIDAIADDASPASSPRARSRRRGWLTVGGVAAAFVAGALVAPPLLNAVSTDSGAFDAVPTVGSDGSWRAGAPEVFSEEAAMDSADTSVASAVDGTVGREMIATANASLRVTAVADAAEQLSGIAVTHGGFVESTSIGERHYTTDVSVPAPPGGDYGWVTIRVPADVLTVVIAELGDVGEVQSSSISRYDVTSQAIDLRARVEATRASVERLTELMAQTGSVSELIEAEIALSERQAQLESYEQQLAALEEQVAMSSLHVELSRIMPTTQPDPAGFSDGFFAGWNGLMVSLNALVIAAGFVIPWIAVIGGIVLVVWLIRRARRRRREVVETPAAE